MFIDSIQTLTTRRAAVNRGRIDLLLIVVVQVGIGCSLPVLVKIRYDRTNMAYLAPGQFLGFLYP